MGRKKNGKKKGRKKSKERKNPRKKETSSLMPRLPQLLSDPVYYKRSGRLTSYNIYESFQYNILHHNSKPTAGLRTSEAGSNKGSNETITFPIPKIGSTAIRVQEQPTNQSAIAISALFRLQR